MSNFKDSVLTALLIISSAALLVFGFLLGRLTTRPTTNTEIQIDTLYLHDTIKVYKPIYCDRRVVDTVKFAVHDSVRVHDTLFVLLEREQLRWRDSLATVWVSGIEPQIDSIEHYSTTMVVTKLVQAPKPRWALGISGGYGAGKDGLTPYFGVGLTYVIKSW